jgi:hypothetical protein
VDGVPAKALCFSISAPPSPTREAGNLVTPFGPAAAAAFASAPSSPRWNGAYSTHLKPLLIALGFSA